MKKLLSGAAAAWLALAAPAFAVDVVVWHDKGDAGVNIFKEIGELYKKVKPDVTVKSLSFPTDQWFARSTASLQTNTAPDIFFNDNYRLAKLQQNTKKLRSMQPDLDAIPANQREFITDVEIKAAQYEGKLLMLPVERSLAALGVRKSWLEKVGEPFPKTWDDALRVATKFQQQDPAGTGGKVYGFALQAGDPSLFFQMVELFGYGTGLKHVVIDADGNIVLDQPDNARAFINHLKLYTDKFVPPETPQHTFVDMYQLIEGGRAGMFRAGDWNVMKWDREGLKGDYVLGPLPAMSADEKPHIVLQSMRSVAAPLDHRNAKVANEFMAFLLTKDAQAVFLKYLGSGVRTDLDGAATSPSQAFFLKPTAPLSNNDFLDSVYPWFPQFKEAVFQKAMAAVANPPKDWNAWIKTTADELRQDVQKLRK